MNYNFRKDIKDGVDFEIEVSLELSKKMPGYLFRSNNTIGYDIDLGLTKLEVKNDIMASRTGNIAIEYECRGKPSGIDATIADWWVQGINNVPRFIRLSVLRILCSTGRTVIGGDKGSNTKMYLVPIERFERHSLSLEDFVEEINVNL
jgi:hypothetical protein